MGYSGLSSIWESDMAGGFATDLLRLDVDERGSLIKKIRKHLSVKENEYNTDGVIDVGMLFRDLITPAAKFFCGSCSSNELFELAKNCKKKMLKEIEQAKVKYKHEWDNESRRVQHLKAYQQCYRALESFIKTYNDFKNDMEGG